MSKRNLATIDRNTWSPLGRLLQEAMAHGLTNDLVYGGLETGQSALQELYTKQLTKNCALATRRVTWDGRVFKYSKSAGACYTGRGAAPSQARAISGNCAAAVLSGADTITFAAQTFDADELKGGFISIFGNPGGAPNDADCPFRRILSNTACAGTTLTITVEHAFDRAIDDAQFCEVYYNPYAELSKPTAGNVSYLGVPNVYVSAADYYFWLQTWGECWITPQLASFQALPHYRDAYFKEDGSICARAAHDTITNHQRAGFMIPPGFTAGPMVMLQISP